MKKTLWIFFVAPLVTCADRPTPPSTGNADPSRAEAHLQKAREAEADKYAPALYGAAVEALEKGETREEGMEADGAEDLAIRALDEAVRVRAAAKEAAGRALREAAVLHSLVETILSHQPPRPDAFPSRARLAEMEEELARAHEAFESGDFTSAGLKAQTVIAGLSSPAPTSGT
jgi:hypothetical protein